MFPDEIWIIAKLDWNLDFIVNRSEELVQVTSANATRLDHRFIKCCKVRVPIGMSHEAAQPSSVNWVPLESDCLLRSTSIQRKPHAKNLAPI